MEITEEIKDQLRTWVKALRSGEYKQTIGTLQDDKGYCCLGVACVLFIPREKLYLYRGCLEGSLPYAQSHAPKWLMQINADFKSKYGKYLAGLNDQEGLSFTEIAQKIEDAYQLNN